MITELPDLFDATGREAPTSTVDLDAAIARGRRGRARQRMLVGASALTGAAVVAGSVAISSAVLAPAPGLASQPGGESSTAPSVSRTGAAPSLSGVQSTNAAASSSAVSSAANGPSVVGGGTPPARVAAISMPDPVPGWPVRRWHDQITRSTLNVASKLSWMTLIGLAVRPAIQIKDASGHVTGEIPDGPEVTIMAGEFELPTLTGSAIDGQTIVARPIVAGVRGYATTFTEKGAAGSALYFSTGHISVEILGFDHVTTEQLVALGNALAGLT